MWAALALALLMSAAGAAGAEPSPGGALAFELQGTRGYSIGVLAGTRPGSAQGEVDLFVGNRHGRVTYVAPADVSASAIEAKLGSLGGCGHRRAVQAGTEAR